MQAKITVMIFQDVHGIYYHIDLIDKNFDILAHTAFYAEPQVVDRLFEILGVSNGKNIEVTEKIVTILFLTNRYRVLPATVVEGVSTSDEVLEKLALNLFCGEEVE
jgi:hypothetical protein